jgi:hypothetical protein
LEREKDATEEEIKRGIERTMKLASLLPLLCAATCPTVRAATHTKKHSTTASILEATSLRARVKGGCIDHGSNFGGAVVGGPAVPVEHTNKMSGVDESGEPTPWGMPWKDGVSMCEKCLRGGHIFGGTRCDFAFNRGSNRFVCTDAGSGSDPAKALERSAAITSAPTPWESFKSYHDRDTSTWTKQLHLWKVKGTDDSGVKHGGCVGANNKQEVVYRQCASVFDKDRSPSYYSWHSLCHH